MDDNRTLEALEYRILDISTTQFAVFMSEAEAILDMDQLNMNSSFSYGVDAAEKLFSSKIDIVVYGKDNVPILKIETRATYKLAEEALKRMIEGASFCMAVHDVMHFTSILYGATRGILTCKLEETSLKHFILPPIDLTKIITRPLNIQLEED